MSRGALTFGPAPCVDDRRPRRVIEIVVVENYMQLARFPGEFSAALRDLRISFSL